MTTAIKVTTGPYLNEAAKHYDTERHDVNLLLGAVDGIYHNHYGFGEVDWSVLKQPQKTMQKALIRELHRLENAQADFLIDHLGPITPNDRLFDAGHGRGGTSLMAHLRFGCEIDAVSISKYQVDFANERVTERGIADKVRYHHANMVDTGLPSGAFTAAWNNESSMYADLRELFSEHRRLLRPFGRYVIVTMARPDEFGLTSKAVMALNKRYVCWFHLRSEYFRALADTGFVPIKVQDITDETIPYFMLREQSPWATGAEAEYLEAYRNGSLAYVLIVAQRT